MEDYKLVEIFSNLIVGIAWPVVVVLVAILFVGVFLYRFENIAKFIETFYLNWKKGELGVITRPPQDQRKVNKDVLSGFEGSVPQKSVDSQNRFDELMFDVSNKQLFLDLEEVYKNELSGLSEVQQRDILLRHITLRTLDLVFERIYNMILGGQVFMLNDLKEHHKGKDKASLKPYYNEDARRAPNSFKEYSYNEYLGFLLEGGLISEKDGLYFITDLGREFLAYIKEWSYPLVPHGG